MPKPKLNSQEEQEVLALHEEDVSTAELAIRFGVSDGTILRILHRHGAMPPRNATKHEKKIICKLSGKRTQRQIAEFLGRSLSFVTFWQRRQGFRAHPKLTARLEDKICKLYKSAEAAGRNRGQARVGRALNVSEKVVHAVLVQHGIPRHTGGTPPMLTPEKCQKAVAMIRAKGAYLKDIAKKLGVNRACIEKLAHAVLGCERFFGGAIWPPLQSAFPERQRHDGCTVGDCMNLLGRIFPDGLPPSPYSIVVPVVVNLLMTKFPFWRTASTPVLENLESHLIAAAATMRGAEQALVN
jgi:transposase